MFPRHTTPRSCDSPLLAQFCLCLSFGRRLLPHNSVAHGGGRLSHLQRSVKDYETLIFCSERSTLLINSGHVLEILSDHLIPNLSVSRTERLRSLKKFSLGLLNGYTPPSLPRVPIRKSGLRLGLGAKLIRHTCSSSRELQRRCRSKCQSNDFRENSSRNRRCAGKTSTGRTCKIMTPSAQARSISIILRNVYPRTSRHN